MAVLAVNGGQWQAEIGGDSRTITFNPTGQSRGLSATGLAALIAAIATYHSAATIALGVADAMHVNVGNRGGSVVAATPADANTLSATVIGVLTAPANQQ